MLHTSRLNRDKLTEESVARTMREAPAVTVANNKYRSKYIKYRSYET
jgi:hypothetical protein